MKFTSLIYPAPNPPSYNCDKLIGELLYVPKDFKDDPDRYVQRYATFSKQAKLRNTFLSTQDNNIRSSVL